MRTEKIEGNFVDLRIAEEKDAKFTLKIRQSIKNTKYMPRIDVDIDTQIKWIKNQADSNDCYFFVIERKNGEKIGTVSLYNIIENEGETGRLIVNGIQIESVETCILFHDFCFRKAGMDYVYAKIEEDNIAALGFAARAGAYETESYLDIETSKVMKKVYMSKANYYEEREKLSKIVERFVLRTMKI